MASRSPNGAPALLIGLDLGTSAMKGVLMRPDGTVLKQAERPVRYDRPAPGRVEHDAEAHWRQVAGLLRELGTDAPAPIGALAMAAASGNTLLTDAQGRPLTPVINWMDRRCVGCPPPALRGLIAEEVRQTVGWACVDSFPLAHLAWLREHEPALYRQARHVCMNTDWLLFRLTGRWRMDTSTATTFHLQDQRRRCWHAPFLERLGLAEDQLSTLTGAGVAVGRLTPEAAAATGLTGSALAATGCFDHPADARAAGILEPGQLLLSCGTSWVGFTPFEDRATILAARLLCDPFRSEQGGPWGGIFSAPAIGPTIDWYVDHVIAPGEPDRLRIFDEAAAEAPRGAGGLAIDLTAPPQPVAGSRAAVSRAVMEGAAMALNRHLPRLREHGFRFERAVLVGGPSKSPVWPGILAEMTGLELTVGSAQAGARGAALLAARALGTDNPSARPTPPQEQNP
jgi:sugar (pentulose or hexulose) kinase